MVDGHACLFIGLTRRPREDGLQDDTVSSREAKLFSSLLDNKRSKRVYHMFLAKITSS